MKSIMLPFLAGYLAASYKLLTLQVGMLQDTNSIEASNQYHQKHNGLLLTF